MVRLFSVPSGDRALGFSPVHPGVHSRHPRDPGACRPAGPDWSVATGRPLSDFSWFHTTGGQASWLILRPCLWLALSGLQMREHRQGQLSWALPARSGFGSSFSLKSQRAPGSCGRCRPGGQAR